MHSHQQTAGLGQVVMLSWSWSSGVYIVIAESILEHDGKYNSIGAITQPCLVPFDTVNASDSVP